jgi:L-fuculose-phosphate aldolase
MENINKNFVATVVRQALTRCLPDTNSSKKGLSPLAKQLFESPETQRIKEEIVGAGKKLWAREYVDGNGGNISYRLSHDYVLCTPTLCSKGDLTVDDVCLVSLENQKAVGTRAHTSEILLHLEIYRAVPSARAVIHCHPPHATAYAITGLIPPGMIIPEQEVFVGPVALAPYETPGTRAFAETVLPYAQHHNTILLANHGIVCWADTVTHAEWYVEVVDTYCRTLMLASQLGVPIQNIPGEKITDLLQIKQKLGLPDVRLPEPHEVRKVPKRARNKPPQANPPAAYGNGRRDQAFDALVARVTEQVLRFLIEGK